MRKSTLELFGCPIQLVRSNGLKFVEFRPENSEVEVVAKVYPRSDEKGEIWPDKGMVEVIKGFRGLAI